MKNRISEGEKNSRQGKAGKGEHDENQKGEKKREKAPRAPFCVRRRAFSSLRLRVHLNLVHRRVLWARSISLSLLARARRCQR